MHRQVRGEEIPSDLLKYHQTVNDKAVFEYPTSDQDKIFGGAFRTDREDFFFEKQNWTKKLKLFYFVKVLFRVNFVFLGDILWFVMLYFVLSFVVFTS